MMRFAPLAIERTGVSAADSTGPAASASDVATPAIREPVDSLSGSIGAAGVESAGSVGVEISSLVTKRAYVVTPKLSHANGIVCAAMGIRISEDRAMVDDMSCPWCETELVLRVVADEQTCPECGTRWMYEDEEAASELPMAA